MKIVDVRKKEIKVSTKTFKLITILVIKASPNGTLIKS